MIRQRTAEVFAVGALALGLVFGSYIGRHDERARWQDGTGTTVPAACYPYR